MISDFSKDDGRCFHFLPFLSWGVSLGTWWYSLGPWMGHLWFFSTSPSHTTAMILGPAQDFDLAWFRNISPSQSDLEKSLTLWRAVFSNSYFYISDSRFRILVKNCLHKVPFFFQYSNRNRVKNRKNPVLPYFLELTLEFASFLHFWPCSRYSIKKRKILCTHTFLQGIRFWNQNCKKMDLKKWPPIG